MDKDVSFKFKWDCKTVSYKHKYLKHNRQLLWKFAAQFSFCELLLQVTLIAQGDVPLSIVMTVCTTLGAVLLTPLLTKILAGTYVPVDAVKLSISTLQVSGIEPFKFVVCIQYSFREFYFFL